MVTQEMNTDSGDKSDGDYREAMEKSDEITDTFEPRVHGSSGRTKVYSDESVKMSHLGQRSSQPLGMNALL